ncbi:TetR/AcrR family transcriptional regulator C-terminal domain-containing protein [Streptomyces virginiae]|uniref:TetR/AcrR family transcriptional regulator C-terminal domain-containing protein n=1 Tax=Streptomyces TaxID=1883 RepID=UPI000526A203|nr:MULTISPECIES: TetR/AcrR family transcriptional regulator C-terminal domain-containing protein [Streptomyces]MCX4717564.1 TetR/AcrR family transcriptional regulator C-terminal domain-containing protein [Streptomyces virginiae]MCX5277416.1 TetR/AcrR family transcriptional regulator C-terminal domain-containing protein [Streptomyces virginiae]MYV74947.1 TetR family transcriptional regulator [Streptomyces sp. SID1046]WSC81474.1 TetR/AcrR family transcriptional regulator C-terminal domain-contain
MPEQPQEAQEPRRTPLSRDRVLRAAVAFADGAGIEALSMRRLAQELGVVPMALYKHVANKEELLDGMVEVVVAGIASQAPGSDWKSAVRARILGARGALLAHSWAAQVIRSRTSPTPAVLAYLDSVIGTFLAGGFSTDLTHHVMHALGSRVLGFTEELFEDPAGTAPQDEGAQAAAYEAMARRYPHVTELARAVAHDRRTVVGEGCDDQFEFEFALDLLLDGFERLHGQGWRSTPS